MTATGDTAQHDMLVHTRVRIPQDVVYRTFARETVVLNLETGLYHGVNPTGGRMLDVLAKVGSVRDAAAVLAREYEVPLEQIQADLCEFCAALLDRGLLTVEVD